MSTTFPSLLTEDTGSKLTLSSRLDDTDKIVTMVKPSTWILHHRASHGISETHASPFLHDLVLCVH